VPQFASENRGRNRCGDKAGDGLFVEWNPEALARSRGGTLTNTRRTWINFGCNGERKQRGDIARGLAGSNEKEVWMRTLLPVAGAGFTIILMLTGDLDEKKKRTERRRERKYEMVAPGGRKREGWRGEGRKNKKTEDEGYLSAQERKPDTDILQVTPLKDP